MSVRRATGRIGTLTAARGARDFVAEGGGSAAMADCGS
jgi:hypothetical protein